MHLLNFVCSAPTRRTGRACIGLALLSPHDLHEAWRISTYRPQHIMREGFTCLNEVIRQCAMTLWAHLPHQGIFVKPVIVVFTAGV